MSEDSAPVPSAVPSSVGRTGGSGSARPRPITSDSSSRVSGEPAAASRREAAATASRCSSSSGWWSKTISRRTEVSPARASRTGARRATLVAKTRGAASSTRWRMCSTEALLCNGTETAPTWLHARSTAV